MEARGCFWGFTVDFAGVRDSGVLPVDLELNIFRRCSFADLSRAKQ